MNTKDYQTIANILKNQLDGVNAREPHGDGRNAALIAVSQTAKAFADLLDQQNPKFDRKRFLKACGMEV